MSRYIRKRQLNFFSSSLDADLCVKKSIPFISAQGENMVGPCRKATITYGTVKHLKYFFFYNDPPRTLLYEMQNEGYCTNLKRFFLSFTFVMIREKLLLE